MIRSFHDPDTRAVFERRRSRRLPPEIHRSAERKLKMLHAAGSLQDLWVPPNNRLEKLKSLRAGQYSIRINRQWRVCFVWRDCHAHRVEICDYH